MTKHTFKSWLDQDLMEMAARSSFNRTMSKFTDGQSDKPAAIVTAFTTRTLEKDGQELNPRQAMAANEEANKRLEKNLQNRGLSFYPVFGSGQEADKQTGKIKAVKEKSYIIQPIRDMEEEEFVRQVKEIIFDPAMEGTDQPQHRQWGGMVKLPSEPKSRMLSHDDVISPASYATTGTHGRPQQATADDEFSTQMQSGPQANPNMIHPDENPDKRIGRRFTLPED